MPKSTAKHNVLIVGGGNAGISVAARLRRAGHRDIAIVDPATTHYYQPLWTLVGGGCSSIQRSAREQASVIPKGVHWYRNAATSVDPEAKTVGLDDGSFVGYETLVVAPGIQLDWDQIPGSFEALGDGHVSTNYLPEYAPKTWDYIKNLRSGTAVFTMPSGPIKCAGAPQKIAYLAADYWRSQGVLSNIRVVLVLPTPGLFGVPVFAAALQEVVDDYGIEVRFNSEAVEIDGRNNRVIIRDNEADLKDELTYDLLHTVPPQSAPDWLKVSPLADPSSTAGYVEVDKYTLQHVRYPDIFALGDASNTPNSKTGAAIRKQAPVVVANIGFHQRGRTLLARYTGYAGCPLTTSRKRMLLAEFDYTMEPTPSIPLIDLTKPRRDMWLVKKYGLPALYWNSILKGYA
jgi:sulfide:quinone oxidoreductase